MGEFLCPLDEGLCIESYRMAFRNRSSALVAASKIFQHRIGDGERSGWKYLNRQPALSDKVSPLTRLRVVLTRGARRCTTTTRVRLIRIAFPTTFLRHRPPTTGDGCVGHARASFPSRRARESAPRRRQRSSKGVFLYCLA